MDGTSLRLKLVHRKHSPEKGSSEGQPALCLRGIPSEVNAPGPRTKADCLPRPARPLRLRLLARSPRSLLRQRRPQASLGASHLALASLVMQVAPFRILDVASLRNDSPNPGLSPSSLYHIRRILVKRRHAAK